MGWSIGYDTNWKRDVGYGVPATCDFPCCGAEIDRGLSYVCGGEPYGGGHGCGLYFCTKHLTYRQKSAHRKHSQDLEQVCLGCVDKRHQTTFKPTPDVPEWLQWKLTDDSWAEWRRDNPEAVLTILAQLNNLIPAGDLAKGPTT